MTQKQAILQHFLSGKSLSTIQATQRKFGYCTKLPTRISDYKKMGFVFITTKIVKRTIYNQSCYFAEYKLDFKNTPKKLINSYKQLCSD